MPGASTNISGADSPANIDRGDPDSPGDGGQRRGARHRPTDEEWSEASAFLNQYSPKRMALAAQLPDGQLKQRLRTAMYGSYQSIRRIQDLFPQIYQLEVQRLTIEDNLFDIHRQFIAAPAAQKAQLRSDLAEQVKALFDNVQQDRQERINRMKSLAAELQTQHDDDARNRDSLISQQVQDVVSYGLGALLKENNPRHGGGPNGPGGPGGRGGPGGPGGRDETSDQNFHPTTNPLQP
jgi:hypothetical protein